MAEEPGESRDTNPLVAHLFLSPVFLKFLSGQATVHLGGSLALFLFSIVAVVTFEAGPAQMGLLVVCQEMPVVVFSLVAGVFFDRHSARKLLVVSSACLALLTGLAPLVLSMDMAGMSWLYVLALLFGTVVLVIDIGLTTLMPTLVEKPELIRANARLMITRSATRALMPAFGGFLARLFQPVLGLFACSLFYICGTFALLLIPEPERTTKARATLTFRGFLSDIGEGLKVLFEIRVLRSVISSSCAGSFGYGIWLALLVLTLARVFDLEPVWVGLVVALGSVANVVGSMACNRITLHLGPGRALIAGNLFSALGIAAMALATHLVSLPLAVFGVAFMGAAVPLYSINQIAIRQAVTPPQLMGRANASRRFIVFSFLPIGAWVGGQVAEAFGLSAGFWLSSLTVVLAAALAFASPLRRADFVPTG